MMKKNSYKLSYFVLAIALISLISILVVAFLSPEKQDSVYRKNYTENIIYQTIDSSLIEDDYGYNEIFNYAIKSYKLKYFDKDGNVVTDPDSIEVQKKKDDLRERGLDPEKYLEDWMVSNPEIKSEYKTFYLTNNYEKSEFEPLDLKLGDNDLLITGTVKDNKVKIDKVEKSQALKDSEYKFLDKSFVNKLNENLRNINGKYNIKNMKFAYYTSLDDEVFNSIDRDIFRDNSFKEILISIVFASILSLVFSLFLKVEEIDKVEKLKKVFKFPIEAVILLLIIFLIFGLRVLDINLLYSNLYLFYSLYFIGLCIISLTVSYFIILLKSIFNKDTDNYLVKNSIINRIFKGLLAEFSENELGDESYKKIKNAKTKFTMIYFGICLVLFILFLFLASIPSSTNKGIIFPMILFGIFIYYILLKNINEVARINIESSEIVKGNYSHEISRSEGLYEGIVNNFNNIGSNLNVAVEEAIKSEKLKTELITNVSHDLKTPLTSIINYSDLLSKKNNTKDEIEEYSKIINEKSNKLKILIEDLFEVSKAASNNIELNRQELDFNSLVAQSVGEWEDKIAEKNIEIIQNLPQEKVILDIDGQKFSRVLDNLFSNISKYALENSRVYVELKNDENIKLTIKNISKYPLNISSDELMERFTRGEKSRTTSGSGLGLSIASSFVRAHGASFDINIDGDLFKVIIEF